MFIYHLLVIGFLFLLILTSIEVEETNLEIAATGSDNTKPVTEVLLLEVTLCKVLSVFAAERNVSGDSDLLTTGGDVDLVLELTGAVVDLNVLLEVFNELINNDDGTVTVGIGNVDDDLLSLLTTLRSL